jgi:hypothetical protein
MKSFALLMNMLFCLNYFAWLRPSASVTKGLTQFAVYINAMDVMKNVRVGAKHKPLSS